MKGMMMEITGNMCCITIKQLLLGYLRQQVTKTNISVKQNDTEKM